MLKKFIIPTILAVVFTGNAAALDGKGSFHKKAHKIKGKWYLVEVDDKQVIAFDKKFKTEVGSNLEIILAKKKMHSLGKSPKFNDAVAIARLQDVSGEQHYVLPASINIEDYESILIHSADSNLLWGGFNIPEKNLSENSDDIESVLENNEGGIRVGL